MKNAYCAVLLVALMVLAAGCSFVGIDDFTPKWNETRSLNESYQVTNARAHGAGVIHQLSLVFLPVFRWGGSFEAGYQDILAKNPGSDDVINVRSNITGMNFLLYQRYDINIYGATIQYLSHGKSIKNQEK